MRITEILHHKGRKVHRTRTVETVAAAARLLAGHNIGALLVQDPWGHHAGLFSERDLVRGLARHGAAALGLPVAELMTADVITCHPHDRIDEAMRMMTAHRIRHLPVEEGGAIVGIVSIGDLVRSLLDEKELEVGVLRDLARAH